LAADGVVNAYHPSYSNTIDDQDAIKLSSFSTREGICINCNGTQLSIEKRAAITVNDTIFLQMSRLDAKGYQFQFAGMNFNKGVTAFLHDSYTTTNLPLSLKNNDTVKYNFTVDLAN